MPQVKFDVPFTIPVEVENVLRQVNNFIGEFERGGRQHVHHEAKVSKPAEKSDFSPRVDIAEDEKNYYVFAELPGTAKEEIKVSVSEERILTIRGTKKVYDEIEGRKFIRTESRRGDFSRAIQLQDDIKLDAIEARFENGILELVLPKAELKEVHVEIK
ncbi:MAG TPA: Hsp20/alpha crystallin family protein [Patescibacteria group bacterium]|nr:Hsp20/alpha crystallin family protein [Patescibacteria group bacterium]